jgi:hypothetical protein
VMFTTAAVPPPRGGVMVPPEPMDPLQDVHNRTEVIVNSVPARNVLRTTPWRYM